MKIIGADTAAIFEGAVHSRLKHFAVSGGLGGVVSELERKDGKVSLSGGRAGSHVDDFVLASTAANLQRASREISRASCSDSFLLQELGSAHTALANAASLVADRSSSAVLQRLRLEVLTRGRAMLSRDLAHSIVKGSFALVAMVLQLRSRTGVDLSLPHAKESG